MFVNKENGQIRLSRHEKWALSIKINKKKIIFKEETE